MSSPSDIDRSYVRSLHKITDVLVTYFDERSIGRGNARGSRELKYAIIIIG